MKTFKIKFAQVSDAGERTIATECVKKTRLPLAINNIQERFSWTYEVWPNGDKMTFEQSLTMDLVAQNKAGITTQAIPVEILSVEEL